MQSDKPAQDFEISSVEYTKDNAVEGEIDHFPVFLVTGKWRGRDFVRKVALELFGRDADEEHVSGFDLSDGKADGDVDSAELYDAIYESKAYKDALAAAGGS